MPTLRYYDGAAYQQLPGMPGVTGPAGPQGPTGAQGPPAPGVTANYVAQGWGPSVANTASTVFSLTATALQAGHNYLVIGYATGVNNTAGAITARVGVGLTATVGPNNAAWITYQGNVAGNQVVASGGYTTATTGSFIYTPATTGDVTFVIFNTGTATSLTFNINSCAIYVMDMTGTQGPIGATGATGPAGPAGGGSTIVSVRAGRTTAFTLATTVTQLIFDNDSQSPWGWDTQNAYNNATGVFTAPVAGKYRVCAQISWLVGATSDWVSMQIYRNGTYVSQAISGSSATTGQYMSVQNVDTIDLAVGDTVSFYQNAGNARALQNDIRMTWMTIDLLSGTGPQGVTGPTGPAYAVGQMYSLVYYQTIPRPTVASSPYTVTHNLGTTFPMVQLYDSVTLQQVMAQVRVLDANRVQITVAQDMPNPVNVVAMGVAASPVPINPGDLATKAYVDAKTATLPAPVTSGTTVQSFTDVLGDVWVAKNGVSGGNWFRARDVLHAKYGRTAAYTYVQSTPTAIPFNAMVRDPYGMWVSGSNAFVVPVGGLWRADTQLCIQFTATGQFIGVYLNMGAGAAVRTNQYAGPAGTTNEYVQAHDCVAVNAGDGLVVQGYSSTASLIAAGLTASDIYFTVKYEGTG